MWKGVVFCVLQEPRGDFKSVKSRPFCGQLTCSLCGWAYRSRSSCHHKVYSFSLFLIDFVCWSRKKESKVGKNTFVFVRYFIFSSACRACAPSSRRRNSQKRPLLRVQLLSVCASAVCVLVLSKSVKGLVVKSVLKRRLERPAFVCLSSKFVNVVKKVPTRLLQVHLMT